MKRNFYLYLILGIGGLGLFLFLYNKTYPTQALELNITKEEAISLSSDFIETQGLEPSDFQPAVIFSSPDTQVFYLQSVLGIEKTNQFIQKDNFLWFWSVRWFKELEKEGVFVGVDPQTGNIIYFSHQILDEAEGESISPEKAASIARRFLRTQGFNLEQWVPAQASQEKQPNRIDHYFEWEKKDYSVGEAPLRLAVGVWGDKVGEFYRYLKVPERFNREYQRKASYGTVLSLISALLTIFIFVTAFICLIVLIKGGQFQWKFSFYCALVVVFLWVFEFFNALTLIWYGYNTTMSKTIFFNINLLEKIIAAILFGLVVFLFGSTGHSLTIQSFTETKLAIIASTKDKRFSIQNNLGILVGYLISFFILGFVTLFYFMGTRYFEVWIPMESKYSNMLGTYLPFLFPLTMGLTAAISEEFIFRLFAISFFKRYLKKTSLAIIIPALIWAFSHTSYNIFPVYIRGIELTIVGIVLGILFLKFGLEAVVVCHYSINAILLSIPLLEAKNLYYKISGFLIVGFLFIPFVLILISKFFFHNREKERFDV